MQKDGIVNEIVEILERKYGNIRSNVEMIDVSTPSTVVRYTNNWKGSFEGWLTTATARYADYVLSVAAFYECVDLHVTSAQNIYLQLQQKVIAPLYECKSDFQIAAELGRRMGFGEYFDRTEEQYIEELLASGHPTMEAVTSEVLKQGPVLAKPLERP